MDDLLLLLIGGAVVWYAYTNRNVLSVGTGFLQTGVEDVTAATMGWQNVNNGPTWVPVINQTESASGIPPNLLARMAYQESHFRTDIINGTTVSPAGALGILQLMPQYFSSVNVPAPFSASDTVAQISEAASELARLYGVFGDWGIAVAAYNDGQANVAAYLAGTRSLPLETQNYVAQVLADVPVPSALA